MLRTKNKGFPWGLAGACLMGIAMGIAFWRTFVAILAVVGLCLAAATLCRWVAGLFDQHSNQQR